MTSRVRPLLHALREYSTYACTPQNLESHAFVWSGLESAQRAYLRAVWSGVVLRRVLLYPIFAGRFPIFARVYVVFRARLRETHDWMTSRVRPLLHARREYCSTVTHETRDSSGIERLIAGTTRLNK